MTTNLQTAHRVTGHKVQLYEEGSFPSPAILDFLLEGLAQNHGVVIVVTKENLAHLERSFSQRGESLQKHIDSGAIIYKDANELLNTLVINNRIDHEAFEKGFGQEIKTLLAKHGMVSAYAEMVDLLLHDGKIELMLQLEDTWNQFIAGRAINLFCGYHIDWVKPEYGRELIDKIVGTHNTLVPIHLNANTPAQHAIWIEFIHARKTKFRQQLSELTAIEEELSRDFKDLQTLNRGVIQMHDQQDRWVAHYLNDDLAENLAALQMSLAAMPAMLKELPVDQAAPIAARLQELVTVVQEMSTSVRSTVDKIHVPLLDEFGLLSALRGFIYSTRSFTKARVTLTVEPPDDFRLDHEKELNVLLALKEAITNAIKHTQASRIEVEIHKTDRKLTCKVTDNGEGFDMSAAGVHLGLPMMRQRVMLLGGLLNMESSPGKGTMIELSINL